jgi:hypothetical protein
MFESPAKSIWWLPTFGFFVFLAVELWIFNHRDRIFEDPGVGRHLRTAEYILETGQVPRTDPLSYTKPGAPWTDFEWAFETTLGELYRAGGLPLVCAFCYAIFAATVLGIYRTLLQSGISLSAVLIVTMVTSFTLLIHFSARPVLFTYLFFALVIEVWSRHSTPRLRDWIFLPLIFIAWANLHAGWMAALAFLALAMTGRLIDRLRGRLDGDEAPLIPWLGLTALCAVVTSINPWGWALYRSVFALATSLKSSALWIEYLPPNFGTPFLADIRMSALGVLFILIVVILARTSLRAPRWRMEAAIPVLFFLWEGLKFQRHVLLLMEIAALPVARDFQSLLRGVGPAFLRDRLAIFQEKQRQAGGDAWLALLAALIVTTIFVHSSAAQNLKVGANVSPQLVAFLRDHPDRFRRPLTTTRNAGPLLWALRPDFHVSIDDRGDFYGDKYVFNFIDVINGSDNWQEKLDAGNYDSLLLDPFMALNHLLKDQPQWKQVWRDDDIVVYWRDKTD